MADNNGCAEQLLSESDEKSNDSSRNRHKVQKQLPPSDTFVHIVPNTDSRNYNPNKFKYKCLRFIYNFLIFLFSLSDTILNILVILYLHSLKNSDTIYNTFYILLLTWTGIVQCFYYGLFIYRYPANGCKDCDCCDIVGICRFFLFLLMSLVFAPFIPIICFFAHKKDCFLSQLFCLAFGVKVKTLFKPDDNKPLFSQLFDILRNRNVGFMIQSVIESFPSAIIQFVMLIYCTNRTDNHNHDHNNDDTPIATLEYLCAVSISITVVSLILKAPLLIDHTHITNKWFTFNYLCIICDFLGFVTAIIWIFCGNKNLFDGDINCNILKFNSCVPDDIPTYQVIWLYSWGIAVLPTLATAITFAVFFVLYLCAADPILLCELFCGGAIGLVFAVIVAHICCWIGIQWLIFDVNKFFYRTKYDSILWNHFLTKSPIMMKDKRLGVLAINYSLLRKLRLELPKCAKFNSNPRFHEYALLWVRDYQTDNYKYGKLWKYLMQQAVADVNNVNRAQEQFEKQQQALISAVNQTSRTHSRERKRSLAISSTFSFNSNSTYAENQFEENQKCYLQKLASSTTMQGVTFSKLRMYSFQQQDLLNKSLFGKIVSRIFYFGITLMYMSNDQNCCLRGLLWLMGVWINIVCIVPYLLSRFIIVAFPWIVLCSEIAPMIQSYNAHGGSLKNGLYLKWSVLAINLLFHAVTVLLLIFHVAPMFYYGYHILPGRDKMPSIDGEIGGHIFEYAFIDMYATYDVLFVSRLRQYYVLQRFGNDIGQIILDYVGITQIGTVLDIQDSINEMNPKFKVEQKYNKNAINISIPRDLIS